MKKNKLKYTVADARFCLKEINVSFLISNEAIDMQITDCHSIAKTKTRNFSSLPFF